MDFSSIGITIALILIGLPFVVRSVQPVLQTMGSAQEEVAASLGASRLKTFIRIIFPTIMPALLAGFVMAFARALGEYGSVIFIAGNIPGISEIVPVVIMVKLEQFDYAGASAVALVMLFVSFIILFLINLLQKWSRRRT
jgi:sulfate transport system permease protein